MPPSRPSIDVCVATYKRPDLLRKLLESLVTQETDGRFDLRIVAADNDAARSAESVVRDVATATSVPVIYTVEPSQSISLARNKALSHATGDYVACIDDDEYAERRWLLRLYDTITTYECDVVHGPAIRYFAPDAPEYARDGTAFTLPNPPTGSTKDYVYATNNCLFRRDLVRDDAAPFDPAFGKTGSGDVAFFERLRKQGSKLVWCQDAKVFEYIPPERANWRWILRRDFRTGNTYYRVYDKGPVDPSLPKRTKLWRLSKRVLTRGGAALFPTLRGVYDARARLDAIERLRPVAFYSGIIAHFLGLTYEEYRGR
jgi:succinoglycan biosynthesis protein ExoM